MKVSKRNRMHVSEALCTYQVLISVSSFLYENKFLTVILSIKKVLFHWYIR